MTKLMVPLVYDQVIDKNKTDIYIIDLTSEVTS